MGENTSQYSLEEPEIKFPEITYDEIEIERGLWLDDEMWKKKSRLFGKLNNLTAIRMAKIDVSKRRKSIRKSDCVRFLLPIMERKFLDREELVDHYEFYEGDGYNDVAVVHPYAWFSDETLSKFPESIGKIYRAPESWYYPKHSRTYVIKFSKEFSSMCLYHTDNDVYCFYAYNAVSKRSESFYHHIAALAKFGVLNGEEIYNALVFGKSKQAV